MFSTIYFEFALQWWKPHLSISNHLEIEAKTRWQVKKLFYNDPYFFVKNFKFEQKTNIEDPVGWSPWCESNFQRGSHVVAAWIHLFCLYSIAINTKLAYFVYKSSLVLFWVPWASCKCIMVRCNTATARNTNTKNLHNLLFFLLLPIC